MTIQKEQSSVYFHGNVAKISYYHCGCLTLRLLSLSSVCVMCNNVTMSGNAYPDLTQGPPVIQPRLVLLCPRMKEKLVSVTFHTGTTAVRNLVLLA